MSKLIALIDCNNFYVACECLFQPKLNNQPVVILSHDNGCIIARSNHIKALQIPIGTPMFKVRKQLSAVNAVAITANMRFYRNISARVMHSLKILTEKHIVYSIDEAFFELQDDQFAYKKCLKIAESLQTWTGIPVSIGVSYSKTLAKIACKLAKQRKQPVILRDADTINKLLQNTDIAQVWGIGRQYAQQLRAMNINSASALMSLPDSYIRSRFGINLLKISYELQGIDNIDISHKAKKNSLSSSKILLPATNNLWRIRHEVARHIGIICRKAFLQESEITTLVIKIYSKQKIHERQFQNPGSNLAETWLNLSEAFVKSSAQDDFICRRVKVIAKLKTNQQQQMLTKRRKTNAIITATQNKFGRHSLFIAAGAYTESTQTLAVTKPFSAVL